jgi:anti-sigma factor RsiW
MNCNEILLYASGEMNATQKQAFEAHLKTCPKCQSALRFITQTEDALAAPAAPAHLVDKVFAKTTRRRKSHWLWVLKPVLTGTALLGIGLLTMATFHHSDKNTLNSDNFTAYMSEHLDDDYQTFSSDLDLFEQYF